MKTRFLCIALLLASTSLSAETLADRFEKRYLGWKDFCAVLDLKITSRSGGERDGQARACVLRETETQGYLRVTVLAPVGAKGTEILSHVKTGGERKQWLYIPATKRATPVNDKRAESPFLGTDLSYVDLGVNLVDPEQMKKTGSGKCDEQACEAYDIEPRPGEYRRQAWIIVDTGALHHIDVHDGDKLVKRMTVGTEVQSEQGYWLPSSVSMENLRSGSTTAISYKEINFDSGQKPEEFDPAKIYGSGGSRAPGK